MCYRLIIFQSFATMCYNRGLFGQPCIYPYYNQQVLSFATYWCVATQLVDYQSNYLFGGIYSFNTDNPVTKGKSYRLALSLLCHIYIQIRTLLNLLFHAVLNKSETENQIHLERLQYSFIQDMILL